MKTTLQFHVPSTNPMESKSPTTGVATKCELKTQQRQGLSCTCVYYDLSTGGGFKSFFANAPEPLSTIVAVTAVLGLRIGETLGLRRSDVDFAKHIIRIRQFAAAHGNFGGMKVPRGDDGGYFDEIKFPVRICARTTTLPKFQVNLPTQELGSGPRGRYWSVPAIMSQNGNPTNVSTTKGPHSIWEVYRPRRNRKAATRNRF